MRPDASSVPIACTLALADRPARLAEFRDLFARGLQDIQRAPTRLQLDFAAHAVDEADVRDLFRREHDCCAFFDFTIEPRGTTLRVHARVPDAALLILDDFEALARTHTRTRS